VKLKGSKKRHYLVLLSFSLSGVVEGRNGARGKKGEEEKKRSPKRPSYIVFT